MERYLTQANDYEGKAVRIAEHHDQYDEYHVIIEMSTDSGPFWLDWIGGEYAAEPDEFDEAPFENLNWKSVK